MTYIELHEVSNVIGRVLNQYMDIDSQSDQQDQRSSVRQAVVGIAMESNVLLPASILGVLKASCCFVYLPPSESPLYVNRIIERAKVQYLIFDQENERFSFDFRLDDQRQTLFDGRLHVGKLSNRRGRASAAVDRWKMAYIMFTSGTTGESKMVRVPHGCIVPNILHLWNEYNVTPLDIIFLSSPLTFDPSVVDIFLALSCGATLLIVTDGLKLHATKLAAALLDRFRITILQTTPTLLLRFPSTTLKRLICSAANESLRILALGGEPFPCTALAPYVYAADNSACSRRLRIYSLYGPTEVSCWSTIRRVAWKDIWGGSIPIGEPMVGTEIRLLNSNGALVTDCDVIGELHIGGLERRCFLDGEDLNRNSSSRLRATGDSAVRIRDHNCVEQFHLVGRMDDQVKRMGKRLNLLQIAQIIEMDVDVKTCVVLLDDSKILRAYVQLNDSDFTKGKEGFTNQGSQVGHLRKALLRSLPRHCQPDFFHFVTSMPTTKHGKVDRRTLLEQSNFSLVGGLPQFSLDAVPDVVMALLKDYVVGEKQINHDPFVSELGIDSLVALMIVQLVEQWSRLALPKALEIMLTSKVSTLVEYVKTIAIGFPRPNTLDRHPGVRRPVPVDSSPPSKRKKATYGTLRIVEKGGKTRWTGSGNRPKGKDHPANFPVSKLKIKWKWNSGKCIDASPVYVNDFESRQNQVFIGSHSGKFACLEPESGAALWIRMLGGRIEASATISGCGRFIVVGCYDFGVYFLDRSSGDLWWKFETGDIVKCTGCPEESSANFYIGSHDHHLYKLNYESKECVWKTDLGSAVFSTPAYSDKRQCILAATLAGVVYCLISDEGTTVWSRSLEKPIFASLVITGDCLVVAAVSGVIYWLGLIDGCTTHRFQADGNIFSAPSVASGDGNSSSMTITSESGSICSIQVSDRTIRWKRSLNSPILSSPFIAVHEELDGQSFCCLSTKSGRIYLLRLDDGEVLAYCDLGGEIFSSPILADGRTFVGCRDDAIYCLEIVGE